MKVLNGRKLKKHIDLYKPYWEKTYFFDKNLLEQGQCFEIYGNNMELTYCKNDQVNGLAIQIMVYEKT